MIRRHFLSSASMLAMAAVFDLRRATAAEEEHLEGEKLDALLAAVAQARKSTRSIVASFVQERSMKLLATSIMSKGKLTVVAPDRIRWELFAPDDVVYWVGPEGLSYRTKTSQATVAAPNAAVSRGLTNLRALLSSDLAPLRDDYALSATRTAAEVTISGSKKTETKDKIRGFALTLDRTLVVPLRATLLEGKSDKIAITFSNAETNVAVEPRTMRP